MMQCSMQTRVLSFECNLVWLTRELDHTQAPKHVLEAMKGRLSVYLILWLGLFLQILQSIGLGTPSPFSLLFFLLHCAVSYRLCGMLLYHDLSPTR